MHAQLLKILAEKEREVDRLKKEGISTGSGTESLSRCDFKGAISIPGRISLIAEIKFASPSAGIISKNRDPIQIGRMYETAGAAAISLITDKRFFSGDIQMLPHLKRATSLPILRKDFIIDAIQIRESFLHGADAVLLIARILTPKRLSELLALSRELEMTCLTEVHDRVDLEKAIACGADIIGINNRDLDTFKVDISTTFDLAPLVPTGCVLIGESGISNARDVRLLKDRGLNAILVGTSLMKNRDLIKKTSELVQAGIGHGKS